MAFADLEISNNQSNKILLFDFQVGVKHHRFTNASVDFTLGLDVYISMSISMSEINSSDDIDKKTVTIKMALGQTITRNAIVARTSSITNITITEVQLGDNTTDIVFKGRVISYKYKSAEVLIPCESIYTSVKRVGLKADYGPNCDHQLYDGNTCRVLPSNFQVDGTVSVVSGADLTVTAAGTKVNDWFTGGYLTFAVSDDLDNTLMITGHTGTVITVEYINSLIVVGTAVSMFAGCDRSAGTCVTKFNNIVNNLSFPFHPDRNPFQGTKVY